jgi:hypothetical protein
LPRPPAILPELTRRAFLARSLRAAGGLAALPLLAPGCSPARRGAAPPALRALSPGEWEVLGAVADTVVPRGGAFALGAADVGLAARIDGFLAEQDPELAGGVRGALWLLEYGAPLLAGRLARFSRLDADARSEVFGALPRRFGLARRVFTGLRQLCLFSFYSLPESWPALGYEGPWVRPAATAAETAR